MKKLHFLLEIENDLVKFFQDNIDNTQPVEILLVQMLKLFREMLLLANTHVEETQYFTQYCNLLYQQYTAKTTVDKLTKAQIEEIDELREMAIEQSGLTWNEMDLIARCRIHGIFKDVNIYSHKIKNKKDG